MAQELNQIYNSTTSPLITPPSTIECQIGDQIGIQRFLQSTVYHFSK